MPERQVNLKFYTDQAGWKVHPDLRARMIQDATELDTSLSDLVLRILSRSLGVAYKPSARKSAPRDDKTQLGFTIPGDLDSVLGARYANRADGIREILCKHYGLAMPVKPRFTRNRG